MFIGAKDLFVGANRTHRLDTGEHEVNSCERIASMCLAPWLWVMGRYQVTIHLNVSDADKMMQCDGGGRHGSAAQGL